MSSHLVMIARTGGGLQSYGLIAMEPTTQAVLWAEPWNRKLRYDVNEAIEDAMAARYGTDNTRLYSINQLLGATPDHKAVLLIGAMGTVWTGTPTTVSLTLKLVTIDPPVGEVWGAVTEISTLTRIEDPINTTTGAFIALLGTEGTTAYVLAPDPDPTKGSVVYKFSLDGTIEMAVCPTTVVNPSGTQGEGEIAGMLVSVGGVHGLAFGRFLATG